MRHSWLVIWPIFALALALLMRDDLSRYAGLAEHGVLITATVTGADCGDHGSVYYAYAWQKGSYRSGDINGAICEIARPGDPIKIWILPDNPHIDETSEPRGGLLNDLVFILLASGVVGVGLSSVLGRLNKARLAEHP